MSVIPTAMFLCSVVRSRGVYQCIHKGSPRFPSPSFCRLPSCVQRFVLEGFVLYCIVLCLLFVCLGAGAWGALATISAESLDCNTRDFCVLCPRYNSAPHHCRALITGPSTRGRESTGFTPRHARPRASPSQIAPLPASGFSGHSFVVFSSWVDCC